ncbi:MAG: 4-(cytidine 5'-diphospho)-2-C-methyl-D-erythritol kinase [Flavobacteriales bacterium]|jgi:4-diphosphocytidyl-2-C-methyl-D-erythritol kinase
MIAFANAKINLGLYVTERRTDGYHNLESIFLPVSLCDVLEAIRSEGDEIAFTTQGRRIDGDAESNLCVKAYRLLQRDFKLGGVEATMLKQVPIGAGLGGGSSDGAHMLKLLNELFSLNLSTDQLQHYAAQLGSDCPFFISNKPAFVHGRGELLDPIDMPAIQSHVVIIHPGIHVGTADAYRGIKPSAASFDLRTIGQLPMDQWQGRITNDFERVVFALHPEIASIKRTLLDQGALYSSMSGSGSAVFGFFDERIALSGIPQNYFVHWGKLL